MKLHFSDQTFSFELLRAASYGLYGGSEIGEALATAHRIREGDFERRWGVKNAGRVFGRQNPIELAHEMQRYSLQDTTGLIQQPTLIWHGEKDHFIPREQVDLLSAALKAPKTLRVFTEAEGAEES